VTRARACILLLALAGLVVAAVWLGSWVRGAGRVDRTPSATAATAAPAVRSAGAAALGILHTWDAERARAYARGRPRRLQGLYVPGSSAGRADLELLRRYHRRGLRVTGMRTQVLSLAVVEHRAGLWRLRVTDRLVGAVAVGPGGRTTLPRDRPSGHEITLMRARDGAWRVAGVREVS
jgi:hypothetical protein